MSPFTLPDNPFIRPEPRKPTPTRYTAETDEGTRTFETTGERRLAAAGEIVLGIFGPAVVNQRTSIPYLILREVTP